AAQPHHWFAHAALRAQALGTPLDRLCDRQHRPDDYRTTLGHARGYRNRDHRKAALDFYEADRMANACRTARVAQGRLERWCGSAVSRPTGAREARFTARHA